ncbi:helix-turn-helix transcriptional regulator [Candidatus Daviesbacteria bacterium]|nr:helix-turn-helix transcriptional regulator [Candidatus Daviesbacteria bacterium]
MIRKKTIGKFVLFALEKAIDGVVIFDDLIHHPNWYAYGGGWEYPLKKSALSQALKRLREKGYIEKSNNKDIDKIIYKLTDQGRELILLGKDEDEIEWDGKWRIVIFDIPENKKVVREVLRGRLKLWGFQLWQKSVWASKKNLTNKLRGLIKELGIEDWVLVIESENAGR